MTIEYDLQHADWIRTHVFEGQRSVNDKAVIRLAEEVSRLREEVALWQRHAQRGEAELVDARNERDGLAAKLARVEALPARWRDAAKREHWNCVHGYCAKELETALRGDE